MHSRNRRPLESKQLIKQDRNMTQHKALEHKERVYVTRSELAVPCTRDDEPMARVPKMAIGKDFLGTRHSLLPQFSFLLSDHRLYIVKNKCTYIYIYICN